MLAEAQLSRLSTSVREQALRQRWRTGLLWTLRALTLVFMLLMLRSVLVWPFADIEPALARCAAQPPAEAQACTRAEIETRRLVVVRARTHVLALLACGVLTLTLSLMVRFGLRRQLQEQMRFAEQVFDAVPMPMSLRTPDGVFLRMNAAAQKRIGLPEQEVIGRPLSDFFPPADVEGMRRLDAAALASREPVEVEVAHSRDGRHEHTLLRVQAVRDDEGATIGLVTVRTDITKLREHQEHLAASNERLRRLSAQMLDAQEQERRRIARDLHDQVGQILTALKLQLGTAAKAAGEAPHALALAREYADEALRHTRDLSASLHPHHLDDLGLDAALHWLVERFIRPLVPEIEVRCRLSPARGPAQSELVAFRVVQESLTNVVRHARASRIGVILDASGGQLAIEVVDDGVGFEGGDERRGTSLGLAGMDDRVTGLGGRLQVDSTPGEGTRVRATLPWDADGGGRDASRSGG